MTTIHYLKTDRGDSNTKVRAIGLHTTFHTDPVERIDAEDFDDLYEAVGSVDAADVDDVRPAWDAARDDDQRGLSVGDVAEIDDRHYVYLPDGWRELRVE